MSQHRILNPLLQCDQLGFMHRQACLVHIELLYKAVWLNCLTLSQIASIDRLQVHSILNWFSKDIQQSRENTKALQD